MIFIEEKVKVKSEMISEAKTKARNGIIANAKSETRNETRNGRKKETRRQLRDRPKLELRGGARAGTNLNSRTKFSQKRGARLLGLGTAFPKTEFTQAQIQRMFRIENPAVMKLMAAGHIKKRHLYFSKDKMDKTLNESQEELNKKFMNGIHDIGVRAVSSALRSAGLEASQVHHFIGVTSTGFLVPGLSSYVSRAMGMSEHLFRLDIVGMGCNAGMTALQSASQWLVANPEKVAVVLCCEVNSAMYVRDDSIRTGIVNSLFGDGAAAMVLAGKEFSERIGATTTSTPQGSRGPAPRMHLTDFESYVMPDHWDAIRCDWDVEKSKWSFYLSKDIPFVMGRSLHKPVEALLARHQLKKKDIRHWVLHTGGGAVIDGAKKSLGLSDFDVRHTRSVLREYGNISSGSFFVSLERLQNENRIQKNDLGILMAMGPGSNIEVALVEWGLD